jgi:repressor of nif and glnA expression
MSKKNEKKQLAILRILHNVGKPMGSARMIERLAAMGQEISERTARNYLQDMDSRGLTRNLGRRGRIITALGQQELDSARVFEKVGFLAAKIDQLTYQMSFDLYRKTGTVIVNVSLFDRQQAAAIVPLVQRVYAAGYSMGSLMVMFGPGESIGATVIPEGYLGLGTVCSITLNGVLRRAFPPGRALGDFWSSTTVSLSVSSRSSPTRGQALTRWRSSSEAA